MAALSNVGLLSDDWNPIKPPGVVTIPMDPPILGSVIPESTYPLPTEVINETSGSPGKRIQATRLDEHGELFWRNHWHIREQSYALGNVLSEQVRLFYVYNAHRTAQNITAIVESGTTAGITLEDNGTPPFSVNAQTVVEYSITVGVNGDPAIDYLATFDFGPANEGSLAVLVTGQRLIVFTYEPQGGGRGGGSLVERWQWETDIMTAADGSEQRVSSRNIPRQLWIMRVLAKNNLELARLENLVYGWQPNALALPIYIDEANTTADIAAGTLNIPVLDNTDRHLAAGEQIILLDNMDIFNFETLIIDSLPNATTITVTNATLNAWPAGTSVYPVQEVNMRAPTVNLYPVNAGEYSFEFRNRKPLQLADEGGVTLYQSLPVWEYPWYISGTYQRSTDAGVNRYDSGGSHYDVATRSYPQVKSSLISYGDGRAEVWLIKRLLAARYGKRKAFYIPSHRDDFVLDQDSSISALTIKDISYTDLVFPNPLQTRRDIAVFFVDGTVNYRAITTAVRTTGVNEVLGLDSPLTQTPTITNTQRICYLYKVRLNSDTLDFVHEILNHTSVGLNIVEVND